MSSSGIEEPISTIYDTKNDDTRQSIDRYPTIDEIIEQRPTETEPLEVPTAKSYSMTYKLSHKVSVNTGIDGSVMSCAWSENGDLLGVVGDEGSVTVFTRHGQAAFKMRPNNSGLPTTCLKWRPKSTSLGSLQVLVTVDVTGQIVHWHVPTEKEIFRLQEDNNQIYSIQYRPDGSQFATTGQDCCVRVYDEVTKDNILTLQKGATHSFGHSNRVFASVFDPENQDVLVSGGWDNTLVMWDLRQGGKPTNTIYGPHLAGQSLDIQNDMVLTGSWRSKDALETWDLRTLKKVKVIGKLNVPKVYTAQFQGTHPGLFCAGGASEISRANSLRLYNVEGDEQSDAVQLSNRKGIYSSSFNRHSEIAVAGNCNRVEIFKMQM